MEKPVILKEGNYSKIDLENFKKEQKVWREKDIYKSQLTELFETTHASIMGKSSYKEELGLFITERSNPDAELRGDYVYFPWSGVLLHMVGEEDLTALRTNRTRNLVSQEEQQKMGEYSAGIAGLSFGNGIALALAYSGIANSMKLADRDIFETTNLNRVRVGLTNVNELKSEVTTREIYEINPYADMHVFADGLTEQNIDEFIGDKPKLNIIFDVVDDFAMKVRIRMVARKHKIPVVMLTSLEDSVLVDVERYDLTPEAEIFHGLLGNITEEMLAEQMSEQEKVKYAMSIVGSSHVSYRNLLSLADIGQHLVSRPHLYGTVSIVCGLAAYITKRIVLGEDMPSFRQLVRFNDVLGIKPNKDDTEEARARILTELLQRQQD